jgi:hypothetical protein
MNRFSQGSSYDIFDGHLEEFSYETTKGDLIQYAFVPMCV